MTMSTEKTKVTAFYEKDNKIVEKLIPSTIPEVNVGMYRGTELDTKLNRFQKKCRTIRRCSV